MFKNIGPRKRKTLIKQMILAGLAIICISALVCICVISTGNSRYSSKKFNSISSSTSGGSKQEDCNCTAIEYLQEEDVIQIKMSFASGSIDLSETCGVPEYSVSFIESPIRLKVEVFDLAYWDYVINSAPVDNSLLITGMFYNIIENSTTFYFNLSKNVTFKVAEGEDGSLTVLLKQDEKELQSGWYLIADLYYEYQEGELPLDEFTPTLCDDNISVLMISKRLKNKQTAEKLLDKLLTGELEGKKIRLEELSGGQLPKYSENTDTFALLSESILSVNGTKTSLPLFFANARFICWKPSGEEALFSKSVDTGENLYIADKAGTKHLLIDRSLATVTSATYSKNEKVLAFVESAEEAELLSIYNEEEKTFKVLVDEQGKSLFGDKITGIALSDEGDKLYVISGDGYYSLKEYDVLSGEVKNLRTDMIVESKLYYRDGKLYYSDCVDEREAIILHNLLDNTTQKLALGADFMLSPDGSKIAVITENYATSICTLNIVNLLDGQTEQVFEDIVTGEYFISFDNKAVFFIIETGDQEFYYQIMRYDIEQKTLTAKAQCINAVFYPSNASEEMIISIIYTSESGAYPAAYIADFTKIDQIATEEAPVQETE